MKMISEFLRFCLSVAILLGAALYLKFSMNASPQAYFVLLIGIIPVTMSGIRILQKAKKQ
ncbi:hypothetical protein [Pontibacter sp. HSC-36F09]|uniref:hypothetical protein n=1 Tax=Pontibacter sp. HSC-36F09 TaxID=2910966 RepID=UPI00209C77B4|nr:hypothetical protein [Pontibacter sp. HSC-36F09]MCP2042246.1 cadmium resistance protein CadD (predicted permease) [Pontibacter sp. HSC-36F09]